LSITYIPDILPSVAVTDIAFLHIDLNNALPESEVAKHLWNRLVPHGAILLDDYAYPGFEEQKIAWDQFAAEKGLEVFSLPTGQGLILKPV
jgi:O-methyltransferase